MHAMKLLRGSGLKMSLVAMAMLPAMPLLHAQQQNASQQTGDEVADAARKAREQKKNAPKPKKVYTDDDIAPRPASKTDQTATTGAASTDASQGTATSTTVDAAAGKAGSEQKNDEKGWRARFKAARDKLAGAEKQLDVMQRDLNKSELQYYPDPQKALKEQNSRKDINDKATKIDAQKVEIAKQKQALSDLEDELRKSGGDPGWARE